MEYLTEKEAIDRFEGKLPFNENELVETKTSSSGSITKRYASPALDSLGLGKYEYMIEKRVYQTTHASDGGEDVVRYLAWFRYFDLDYKDWTDWEQL